ncbi:MAG: flagellin FliC, partial [Methylococcales bacterium]|nr:flagellin FliC [Methylococcales bacterium]
MALVVNSNIFSANAQRNLTRSSGDLQTSLQRLSSGLRINSAKDDAAGQFSVETLTADIRGVNQAIRNAGDGISLVQTAEGALGQITNNLQRVRELAVQSASGTIEDRTGLQAEVDQLTQEVSRIVATTNFNGVSLLSAAGAGSALTFQIGQDGNTNNQVTVQLTAGTGSISSVAGVTTNLTGTNTVAISTAAAASAALAGLDTAINTLSQK